MHVVTTAKALRILLGEDATDVAFVPTMGALHAGHVSLVEAARAAHRTVVCSIFVNPTQFNESADLEAYPRTPKADIKLLKDQGCDIVYLPEVDDIYPAGYETPTGTLDFGTLTVTMEGAKRPGHFAGVAEVVYRLLDIVRPTTLFLGRKDYQQVAVIRSMIRQLNLSVEVAVAPTVREPDGLALSSRNRRLSEEERAAAATIHRHLKAVASGVRAGWAPRGLEETAMQEMSRHPLLRPEYVSVFDGDTLQPWLENNPSRELVVATAVHCGPVRLIDNYIISTTPEDNP